MEKKENRDIVKTLLHVLTFTQSDKSHFASYDRQRDQVQFTYVFFMIRHQYACNFIATKLGISLLVPTV